MTYQVPEGHEYHLTAEERASLAWCADPANPWPDCDRRYVPIGGLLCRGMVEIARTRGRLSYPATDNGRQALALYEALETE